MDHTQTASPAGSASSARLALEISQLVSRALAGEAIDMPAEGNRLAGRFSELGMTGEMIASAIARALSMVGTIRSGAENGNQPAAAVCDAAEPAPGEPAADLADLIGPVDDPIIVPTEGDGDAAHPTGRVEDTPVSALPNPGVVGRVSRGSVAAVRRAFFRG